jgi:Zn-dependent protease
LKLVFKEEKMNELQAIGWFFIALIAGLCFAQSSLTIKVFQWRGVALFSHWSFTGLLLFFAWKRPEVLILYLAVFASIVVHEYGHCLAAQKFKLKVKDITLFPIGGAAWIDMPSTNPKQEFFVTIAGPATNLAIALISGIACWIAFYNNNLLLGNLLWFYTTIQLMIVAFNFLPVFPMDGGRLFRSLFSMLLGDPLKATKVAVRVGQVMAVFAGFGLWYFLGSVMAPIIMAIICLAAQGELWQMKEELKKKEAKDRLKQFLEDEGLQNPQLRDEVNELLANLDDMKIEKVTVDEEKHKIEIIARAS